MKTARAENDHAKGSWWRDLGVLVAVTLCSSVAVHRGWLNGLQSVGLDALLRLPVLTSRFVTIVEIDDEDYDALFEGRSPLDPGRLHEMLAGIARGHPRLVVVDLDTSPDAIASAAPADADEPNWPPTVWARSSRSPAHHGAARQGAGVAEGIAAFPVDGDAVMRRYHRRIHTPAGEFDSLPWAAVQIYCVDSDLPACHEMHAEGEDANELLLNFAGDRFEFRRVAARNLLAVSSSAAWGRPNAPLADRIVVVGGTFGAARDVHATPLGETNGVDIIARAIESELQSRGIRPVNELTMIGMDLLGGVLLILVHRRCTIRTAFLASLVGMPSFALLGSVFAFYSASRWMNYAPTFLGVFLHQLYEDFRATGQLDHRRSAPPH